MGQSSGDIEPVGQPRATARRLLASSAFRYTLLYTLLFALSVAGVGVYVYAATLGVVASQTDDTIMTEIAGLEERYRRQGLPGLVAVVQDRIARVTGRRNLYLVTDAGFRPLAGNLERWPESAQGEPGWVEFLIQDAEATEAEPLVARARTFELVGGFRLLVGRDTTERSEVRTLITEAALGALVLTVLLGVAGGALVTRRLLNRIESMNRGAAAILAGDLSRRMPVSGADDEFDRLAAELNAMLDQIERLVAGMRQVTDNVAHDMRGPLSRLRSRVEVTLMGEPDVAAYRAVLKQTINEADQLLSTFNALLDIAQAESGALRQGFATVDVSRVVADVCELYEPLSEDAGLTFHTEIADGLALPGHAQLLFQALANLLDNAIKYTPAGGLVRLVARAADGGIQIVVADSGPGIPAEDRDRVLDRFVRLEASRSTPGSGLGLSLVKAVAELHHGNLVLEDNEPGLRVRVILPAAGTAASPEGT